MDYGMVATDEKIWQTRLGGKHRRAGAAACSALEKSVGSFSRAFTRDQPIGIRGSNLGDVADQSLSLDIGYALLRQEPKSRLSEGAAFRETRYTSNGSTQTETANAQNQITSISGSTAPTYDANGNMTTDQAGNTYTYNAWNQLVEVKNAGGAVIVQYSYNALGQRTSESYPVAAAGIPAGTVKYLYYSASSIPQVIEERWNGTASNDVQYQYVWSASYVNAMILRDTYSGGTLQGNDRIYTAYDVNYNVTSLVGYNSTTQSWGVVERFAYSPYGTVTDLAPGWFSQSDQLYWQYMYQGGRHDPVTGLYHFDHREYSASLGTWTSQDPLGYTYGPDVYEFEGGSPIDNLDWLGEGHRKKGDLNKHQHGQNHGRGKAENFKRRNKRGRDAQAGADGRRLGVAKQICKSAAEGAAAGATTAVIVEGLIIIIGLPVGF